MNNIIVFDCETGGLDYTKHPITQIALICLDGEDLKELFRYDSYIKPYENLEITDKALEVSLIDKRVLSNAPTHKVVFSMLKEFFKKSICKRSKPTLVGHNVPFDIGMLRALFKFNNSNLSDFLHSNNDEIYYEDTQRMMMRCFPDLGRYNLGNCCEKLEVPLHDAHGAIGDTEATVLLYKKILSKMRSGKQNDNIEYDPKAGKVRHNQEKPFLF